MSNFKDLKGMKFGKLKVIKKLNKNNQGNYKWLCICECGNKTIVAGGKLKSGSTKSCGCLKYDGLYRINDLKGQRFGKLTVTELSSKKGKGRKIYWFCKCDCGKVVEVSGSALIQGNTTSCGCSKIEFAHKLGNKYKDILIVSSKADCFDGTKICNLNSKLSKNNTSGFKGVTRDNKRNKWVAQIGMRNQNIFLGKFDKLEDSIQARKEAEEKFFKPVIEEYKNKEYTNEQIKES